MSGNFSFVRISPLRVPALLPAVVDVDVGEAARGEAARDHGVGCRFHLGLVHREAPDVPGVPAERRGLGERVRPGHDPERRRGVASGAGDGERHDRRARLHDRAAQDAGLRVEGDAGRKARGREGQRALARRRDAEQERSAGRRADDAGVVDRRLGVRARGHRDGWLGNAPADDGRRRSPPGPWRSGPRPRRQPRDRAPCRPGRRAAASSRPSRSVIRRTGSLP